MVYLDLSLMLSPTEAAGKIVDATRAAGYDATEARDYIRDVVQDLEGWVDNLTEDIASEEADG